jgi:hypothetical protein
MSRRALPGAIVTVTLTLTVLVGPHVDVPWLAPAVVAAQQDASSEPPAPIPEPEGDGGWTFDDEEEAQPTWADEFRNQAADIAAVGAFLVLAFVSFFRKSVALKYITLIAAVAFLGVSKSLLISIVNVFALLGGNLPIFRPNLAWYLLAVVTVVSTILWGRVYCGRVCAFGALTQLVDAVVPDRWKWNVPRALEKRAAWIKYGILGGALGSGVRHGRGLGAARTGGTPAEQHGQARGQ